MRDATELHAFIRQVHGRLEGIPEPDMAHFATCYELHYWCLVQKLMSFVPDEFEYSERQCCDELTVAPAHGHSIEASCSCSWHGDWQRSKLAARREWEAHAAAEHGR